MLFIQELKPSPLMKVLDVGYSEKEYSTSDNIIEKQYPYKGRLTALGIERPEKFLLRYPEVRTIQYDGSKFPFKDKEFDICWSNAVIEHVGTREQQQLFIREIRRVSHKGFITTPNALFPIELHTRIPILHYFSKSLFDSFLRKIGKEWATGDYMNLLSFKELIKILHNADITRYKIVRNKFFGFTLDFVVIF
jgi:ubiquinone/menaquinone biosynthesis C-methylase UbiE